jgi:hypothetical protein
VLARRAAAHDDDVVVGAHVRPGRRVVISWTTTSSFMSMMPFLSLLDVRGVFHVLTRPA